MKQLSGGRSACAFICRDTDQITGVQFVEDQFLGVAGADRWPQVIGHLIVKALDDLKQVSSMLPVRARRSGYECREHEWFCSRSERQRRCETPICRAFRTTTRTRPVFAFLLLDDSWSLRCAALNRKGSIGPALLRSLSVDCAKYSRSFRRRTACWPSATTSSIHCMMDQLEPLRVSADRADHSRHRSFWRLPCPALHLRGACLP